jgi:DNA-binding transcriptional MerR regulator
VERPYLSIGEVLALLKGEFPEITISKIRFLEKGGLVNPERTPSGYRKFYDADIERLRQVLRLQKEQFLPLRVIREVLDGEVDDGGERAPLGEPGVLTSVAGTGPTGAWPESEHGDEGAAPSVRPRPSGAMVLASVAPVATSAAAVARVSPAEEAPAAVVAPLPLEERRPPAHGGQPEGANGRVPLPMSPRLAGLSANRSATVGEQDTEVGPRSSVAGPSPTPSEAPSPVSTRAQQSPSRANAKPDPLGGDIGMTLTAEELCAAVGIDQASLDELRRFGLVKPRMLGGTEYFGEDELTIATLAARLARHGVQPRHLRMYLTAAEREASFVAQLVLPYLKQRNPDARRRAAETAEEVTRLGQSLRVTLLRLRLQAELTF